MPFITQGKTNLKYILIVVILGLLVGGGILGYYYLWIKDLEARLTELGLKLLVEKKLDLKEWEIQLIGGKGYVSVNRDTGEERILESIEENELISRIGQEFDIHQLEKKYGVLNLIGFPKQGEEIYFTLVYEYSGPVFGLNINSLKLRKVESVGWLGRVVFSPTGDRAVSLGEYPSNVLHLICFNTDTKTPVVTLEQGTTFEERVPELDSYFDIKWVNDRGIEYKVYKVVATELTDPVIFNEFLETRSIELPEC